MGQNDYVALYKCPACGERLIVHGRLSEVPTHTVCPSKFGKPVKMLLIAERAWD